MAWLFKRTLLKGHAPLLIMELPPYKRPSVRVVLRHMFDRSMLFLRRAGTVILVINMVLWVLATYPRSAAGSAGFDARQRGDASRRGPDGSERAVAAIDRMQAGERLRHSFAGILGRAIEPLIAPLGFDWKIGIGHRGVVRRPRGVRQHHVHGLQRRRSGGLGGRHARTGVGAAVAEARPDGSPVYTPLTGVTLMVFYVFALQCVSTIAVVRRETNAWKWPLFQLAYMTALAWVLAFLTYQGGRMLGWG
jgi:ferrous iron transport protein B